MEQDFSGTSGQAGSSGKAGEVTQQAKQQGQQFTRRAREQAGELANRGGEQVKSQLANQKHEASQRLIPMQAALRETAQQMRKQGQDSMSRYAERAADGVERTSSYLRETDVDEMTDEVRGFARRRPALFLGGAAALGFLATRFLKSSSQGATPSGDVPGTVDGAGATYRADEPATAWPAGGDSWPDPANERTVAGERFPVGGQAVPDGGGPLGPPRDY